MCGIVGFVGAPGDGAAVEIVTAMASRIVHRGPDDHGVWVDWANSVALGHRRLAIVDLSEHGRQPMVSSCGRFVLVLNGEIYNYEALRRQLSGMYGASLWRGYSDTEVLLEAVARLGVHAALRASRGMFAMAIWDRETRTLTLARDRLGEKPLYYGRIGKSFVFGSELKALLAFPGPAPEVDRAALAAFVRFGYVPAPASIYVGLSKLPPGSLLQVHVGEGGRWKAGALGRYWRIEGDDLERRRSELARLDDQELTDTLGSLITESIDLQRCADVPLGAYLSGGIDSSLVVALMQACSAKPVRTFTIGFGEEGFDEAPHARAVAAHLGTEHTELYAAADMAAALIPRLPEIWDEPFADSSQLPTYLVARMTRQHVTVALSGDGGDELFAGYARYRQARDLWRRMATVPAFARRALSGAFRLPSERHWDVLLAALPLRRAGFALNGHRIRRAARLLAVPDADTLYLGLQSIWSESDRLLIQPTGPGALPAEESMQREYSLLGRMRRFDIEQYLPDDILVKVDRSAMAVSLETRAPLLDHCVAEFAWALPERVLERDGRGKWILREILDRYVPRALIERPKAGFSVPLARWLRRDLRDWAEALLEPQRLREEGFFSPDVVRTVWHAHLDGTRDYHSYLWTVLMFQAWHERWRSTACAVERQPA